MRLFTQWELGLLSSLLSQYEKSDFNCGAFEKEQIEVKCEKLDGNIHLDIPCTCCKDKWQCKYEYFDERK